MSGYFFNVVSPSGIKLPATPGGPPHTTLAYLGSFSNRYKENPNVLTWMWSAAPDVAILMMNYNKAVLNSVKINKFFHGGLGRDRIDILLLFDDATQDFLMGQMKVVLHRMGCTEDEIKVQEARRHETPFHVTVGVDVDLKDKAEIEKWQDLTDQGIPILFSGCYLD